MKILVADDNDAVRTGLCEFLERADRGYNCEGASDGDEALAKAKASKPDVVVLDMLMPGMSGLAAARLFLIAYQPLKSYSTQYTDQTCLARTLAGMECFVSLTKQMAIICLPPSVRSPRHRNEQQANSGQSPVLGQNSNRLTNAEKRASIRRIVPLLGEIISLRSSNFFREFER